MKHLVQAFHLPYQRASGHMRFKSYFPMLDQSEKPPKLLVPCFVCALLPEQLWDDAMAVRVLKGEPPHPAMDLA